MYAILNDSWRRQVTEKHLREGLQHRERAYFVHRNYAQQQLSISKTSLAGNVCGLTGTILDPFSNKFSVIGKYVSTAVEIVSFCYNIYSNHAVCKQKRSLKEWTLGLKTHIGHLKECLETLERGRGGLVNFNDNGNSMQRNDLVPQYAQNSMENVINMISLSLHLYLQNIENKNNKIVVGAYKALKTAHDSFLSMTEVIPFFDKAANAIQNTANAVLPLRDEIEAIHKKNVRSYFRSDTHLQATESLYKIKRKSANLIDMAKIVCEKIKEMKDDVDKVNRMLCLAKKTVKTRNQNPENANEIAIVLLGQTSKDIIETKDVISKLQNGGIVLKQHALSQVRGANTILEEVSSFHELLGDIDFKKLDDQRKKFSQALEGTNQIAYNSKLELNTKKVNASIEDACGQIFKLDCDASNTSLKEESSLKEKALAMNKQELVFHVLSILVNVWKIKTNKNTLKKKHVHEGAISCSCNRSVDLVRESMRYNQRITRIIRNDGDIIIWSLLLFGGF